MHRRTVPSSQVTNGKYTAVTLLCTHSWYWGSLTFRVQFFIGTSYFHMTQIKEFSQKNHFSVPTKFRSEEEDYPWFDIWLYHFTLIPYYWKSVGKHDPISKHVKTLFHAIPVRCEFHYQSFLWTLLKHEVLSSTSLWGTFLKTQATSLWEKNMLALKL